LDSWTAGQPDSLTARFPENLKTGGPEVLWSCGPVVQNHKVSEKNLFCFWNFANGQAVRLSGVLTV